MKRVALSIILKFSVIIFAVFPSHALPLTSKHLEVELFTTTKHEPFLIPHLTYVPKNQIEHPAADHQKLDDSSPVTSAPIEELGRRQIQNVITALRHAGVFGSVAGEIDGLNLIMLPQGTSIFVPSDMAMQSVTTTQRMYIMQYHVVTQRLTFAQLLTLKTGDRLPTLFPGNAVEITSSQRWNFTLDDVLLISPDLYSDSTIIVHGINGVLNITRYGTLEQSVLPSPTPAPIAASSATSRPPTPVPTESPGPIVTRKPDFQTFIPSGQTDTYSLATSMVFIYTACTLLADIIFLRV